MKEVKITKKVEGEIKKLKEEFFDKFYKLEEECMNKMRTLLGLEFGKPALGSEESIKFWAENGFMMLSVEVRDGKAQPPVSNIMMSPDKVLKILAAMQERLVSKLGGQVIDPNTPEGREKLKKLMDNIKDGICPTHGVKHTHGEA